MKYLQNPFRFWVTGNNYEDFRHSVNEKAELWRVTFHDANWLPMNCLVWATDEEDVRRILKEGFDFGSECNDAYNQSQGQEPFCQSKYDALVEIFNGERGELLIDMVPRDRIIQVGWDSRGM